MADQVQIDAVASGYVYLKNISGTVIKPITDLSAINMTTTNGIAVEQVNGGTIGIRDGYIESCYYAEMVDPGVGPANVDSAYIEGGTMYTLLGGYAISDQVPSENASPYRVPSEVAVRAAIDAYVATGGSDIVPGNGITVSGGSIAVAAGNGINVNSYLDGGVSVKAKTNGGVSVTSDGVGLVNATNSTLGGIAGASNGVTIVDGVVQAALGDGLQIKSNEIAIKPATTEEILEGGTVTWSTTQNVQTGEYVRSRTITPADDLVDTPNNLRSALSLGQAVDVCCPISYRGNISGIVVNGSTITTDLKQAFIDHYLDDITILDTTGAAGQHWMGWYESNTNRFPKGAGGLVYLFVADVRNAGDAASYVRMAFGDYSAIEESTIAAVPAEQTTFTRIWSIATCPDTNNMGGYLDWAPATTGNKMRLDVYNFRQYEVTNLTDDAIKYLAHYGADPEHPKSPDSLFRATSVFDVRNRYLVKNDMVCPWTYTISMPDNSDMTVAAGLSYKIKYTDNAAHKVTVDTIPTDAYGWDTHIQMFVKDASMVVFQKPLVLMDALSSNSGHNLSVKYRNGDALVYVDDKNAGKMVTLSTCSDPSISGELNYFMTENPGSGQSNYIIFGAPVAGVTCDFGTVTAQSWDNNLIGNGPDVTYISGTVYNESKQTVLQDLTITDSTMGGTGWLVSNGNTRIAGAFDMEDSSKLNLYGTNILDGTLNLGVSCQLRVQSDSVLTSTKPSGASIGSGILVMNSVVPSLYAGSTLENITITGANWTANNVGIASGDCTFRNCEITGNTSTGGNACVFRMGGVAILRFIGCNIHHNVSPGNMDFWAFSGTTLSFTDTTFGTVRYTGTPIYVDIAGACKGAIHCSPTNITGAIINIASNSAITLTNEQITAHVLGRISVGNYTTPAIWTPGGQFTVVTAENVTRSMSGCVFTTIDVDGSISANDEIVLAAVNTWTANNAILASPIDASKAVTVQITGTTLQNDAVISKEPNKIFLVNGSTNTFDLDETAVADTDNVLSAPIIITGNVATSPAGTATIVTATGSTGYVGFGTYIKKNGASDFSTAKTTVSTATGLAAGLNDANTFVFLTNNLETASTFDTAKDVVKRCILTAEYEPIIGGTYSLSAGTTMTVNETTKNVAITNGTLSATDLIVGSGSTVTALAGFHVVSGGSVRGGGKLVLNDRIFYGTSQNTTITNITFTNNRSTSAQGNGAVARGCYGATFDGCTFTDMAMYRGCLDVEYSSTVSTPPLIKDCTFINNVTTASSDIAVAADATAYLAGVIKFDKKLEGYGGGGTFIIKQGTTLDVTGNTNTNVVTVGSTNGIISMYPYCSMITTTGSSVALPAGVYTTITNTGTCTPYIMESKTVNDDILVPGGTICIRGTNTLDATVSGDGTTVIANNAVISSTIPAGQTIGTGVIATKALQGVDMTQSQPISGATFSNVTLSGMTVSEPLNNMLCNCTFNNCVIENNTLSGQSGNNYPRFLLQCTFTDCTVLGNTGAFSVVAGGTITNGTFQNINTHNLVILDGNITVNGWISRLGGSWDQGIVHIIRGSSISCTGIDVRSSMGTGQISVGYYDSSNVWHVDGTATVKVLYQGAPLVVSGTGTYINYDRTTDMTTA